MHCSALDEEDGFARCNPRRPCAHDVKRSRHALFARSRQSRVLRPAAKRAVGLRLLDAVEYATLEWVDWFNNRRLLSSIGDIPPAEAEAAYYASLEEPTVIAAWLKSTSFRQTRGGSKFTELADRILTKH